MCWSVRMWEIYYRIPYVNSPAIHLAVWEVNQECCSQPWMTKRLEATSNILTGATRSFTFTSLVQQSAQIASFLFTLSTAIALLITWPLSL